MQKSGKDISPFTAILIVLTTFLLSLFLGAAILILFDFSFIAYSFLMVFGELFLVVIPLGYMLYKKVVVSDYIGLKVEPKIILLGIAFGVFLLFFNLVISNILFSIFGVSEAVEESNKRLVEISSTPSGLVPVVLSLSLAGLCEEFTFRGFLQTTINNKYSSGVALLVSSLIFGLFHFDPQGVYIISAFLMGLVLGYIYLRWRSYVISAVAHSTLNLIVLAILLLGG